MSGIKSPTSNSQDSISIDLSHISSSKSESKEVKLDPEVKQKTAEELEKEMEEERVKVL
jgi:hypothetical protein